MNLQDIAQLAGVSRSTVSRVINNDTRVSDDVRRRVQDVVQRVGYTPNASARALASRRTQIVGLVMPTHFADYHADRWFPLILSSCLNAANARDLSLMLVMGDPDDEAAGQRIIERFVHSRIVDGLITLEPGEPDAVLELILQSGIPHLSIGEVFDDRVSWVDGAQEPAVRTMTEALIRNGARRFALIRGPHGRANWDQRSAGFWHALRSAGLGDDAGQEYVIGFDVPDARRAAAEIFAGPVLPDAIVCGSDWMAHALLGELARVGRRAPDDLMVVGFDDFERARNAALGLTTAELPHARIAARAMDHLLSLISTRPAAPVRERVDAPVVWRHSHEITAREVPAALAGAGEEGTIAS